MNQVEIISLIVTFICVASFAIVFTLIYRSYQKTSISDIKQGKVDIELIDSVLYEKQDKVVKRRKVTNIIRSVVFYLLMIIIVPLLVLSVVNKIQGKTTMINGQSIMVVSTGSMSYKHPVNDYLVNKGLDNQFKEFSIIVLNDVEDEDDIHLYDVIAFKNNQGKNIIHRVKSIYVDDYGVVRFETRGDASESSDTYHPCFDDIIGIYANKKVDTIGIFVIFLQSAPGIITIISLAYCLLMVDKVSNKIAKEQDARLEHLSHIITQIADDEKVGSIKASYKETIYYKGFAYYFNEDGFISKEEIFDEEVIDKTENTVIKVKENNDSSQQVDEIVVDEESKGE